MALITCPECGEKVSDKSISCPHCGYPMENINNSQLYSMVLVEMQKNANVFLLKSILEQVFDIPKGTASTNPTRKHIS